MIGIEICKFFSEKKHLIDFRIKTTAFQNEEETKDPRIAVLRNTSFRDLPPCLLIAAELDRFRDDSYGINKQMFIIIHHLFLLQNTKNC